MDGWKLLGILALGSLAVYGIVKLLEENQHKDIWIQVRKTEDRVGVVEGKVLVHGQMLSQAQLDVRMLQTQNSNTMQRVVRVETFLTQPLLPPEAGENGDGWHLLN